MEEKEKISRGSASMNLMPSQVQGVSCTFFQVGWIKISVSQLAETPQHLSLLSACPSYL